MIWQSCNSHECGFNIIVRSHCCRTPGFLALSISAEGLWYRALQAHTVSNW